MNKVVKGTKTFVEWIFAFAWKLVLLALALGLGALLIVVCYYAYLGTNSAKAYDYLSEKYAFGDSDYVATGYVQYVYSEINDCKKTWFKECTDDPTLAYKYVFKPREDVLKRKKDGEEIIVYENKDGEFTDNYRDNEEKEE